MIQHRIALLFSGGGSHYVGMGRYFYHEHEIFRSVIAEASDALHMDIRKLCFETDIDSLSDMNHSQIAIYTVSVGMYRVFLEMYGIEPAMMGGHSLGEYSALACAGVFSFADGLAMIRKRGELLDRIGKDNEGRMMAVNGLEPQYCEELVGSLQRSGAEVYISNYNSPRQFILSGKAAAIAQAATLVPAAGGQAQVLRIPSCSHCPLMNPVLPEFSELVQSIPFNEARIPVFSNSTGTQYTDQGEMKATLPLHLVQPVFWEKMLRSMNANGADIYIEMGPQSILKSLNHYIDPNMATVAFDEVPDRHLIDGLMQKLHRQEQSDIVGRCRVAAVSIPYATTAMEDHFSQEEAGKAFAAISACKQKMLDKTLSPQQAALQCLEQLDTLLACKGIETVQRRTIMENLVL